MKTHIGSLHVTVNPGSLNEFVITRQQQLGDAVLTIRDLVIEHNDQTSSVPCDKSFSGLEATLKLNICDIDISLFGKLTNPGIIRARRLDYLDLTGYRVPKHSVLIRPYEGLIPTLKTDNWFTFHNAGFEISEFVPFGKRTQSKYQLLITGYTLPALGFKLTRGSVDGFGLENLNKPPTVALSRVGDEPIREGQELKLQATASDVDGFIDKVEFYQNSTKIGEVLGVIGQNINTFTFVFKPLAGSFNFGAVAIDNNSERGTSNNLAVSVSAKQLPFYNLSGTSIFE